MEVRISSTADFATGDLLVYLQQLDLPFELSVSELEASLKNSQFIALAWAEDRLVGVASAISDLVTNAYLTFISVIPEFRNRGIGHRLLTRVQQDSKGTGLFGTVANRRAKGFYEKTDMQAASPDFVIPMSKVNK